MSSTAYMHARLVDPAQELDQEAHLLVGRQLARAALVAVDSPLPMNFPR